MRQVQKTIILCLLALLCLATSVVAREQVVLKVGIRDVLLFQEKAPCASRGRLYEVKPPCKD
jgi:hypothetical protein